MRRLLVLLTLLAVALPALGQQPPLSPEESLKRFKLPEGFRITLFAGEPDVAQPIAMTLDDRGRLWVVESASYPHWVQGKTGKDRILIFEDRGGKGRFDPARSSSTTARTCPASRSALAASGSARRPICSSSPSCPARTNPPARRRWCSTAGTATPSTTSSTASTWGPDGWLYGCNGIHLHSWVGKPGTPQEATARPSTAASGATIRPRNASRRSPGAPPIRGDSTSTPTARCSSPIA